MKFHATNRGLYRPVIWVEVVDFQFGAATQPLFRVDVGTTVQV